MSKQYEKARAIAEAAANHWDKFDDSAGVNWLADQIRAVMSPVGLPDDRGLCECRIGQCRELTERCREIDQ